MLYADSSALTKLVLDERESTALLAYLRDRGPIASSIIALAELIRAVRRLRPDLEADANAVLDGITLIDLDRESLETAATLEPAAIRTLDAIHIATALALGNDLEAIVTYDARMAAAARTAALEVATPE